MDGARGPAGPSTCVPELGDGPTCLGLGRGAAPAKVPLLDPPGPQAARRASPRAGAARSFAGGRGDSGQGGATQDRAGRSGGGACRHRL